MRHGDQLVTTDGAGMKTSGTCPLLFTNNNAGNNGDQHSIADGRVIQLQARKTALTVARWDWLQLNWSNECRMLSRGGLCWLCFCGTRLSAWKRCDNWITSLSVARSSSDFGHVAGFKTAPDSSSCSLGNRADQSSNSGRINCRRVFLNALTSWWLVGEVAGIPSHSPSVSVCLLTPLRGIKRIPPRDASNYMYWSILRSIRDTTTGHTTDGWETCGHVTVVKFQICCCLRIFFKILT